MHIHKCLRWDRSSHEFKHLQNSESWRATSSLQVTASHRTNVRYILGFDWQKLSLFGQSDRGFLIWPDFDSKKIWTSWPNIKLHFLTQYRIQHNFITRLVSPLKPRTKQAPICSMLIYAICVHILKDNQAAFNVNFFQPNTTKISGLILLFVCCLQVFWVYIYSCNLTRLNFMQIWYLPEIEHSYM